MLDDPKNEINGTDSSYIKKGGESHNIRFKKLKIVFISCLIIIILVVTGEFGRVIFIKNDSPVPKMVIKAVNYPIYYPDQKKLPSGYMLNINSFKNPVANGAYYTVTYNTGKQIIFSLQEKPSDRDLEAFINNYIVLHNDYQTSSGLAKIGAYNNHGVLETLISLPTNDKTWLIITAPPDINQNQLKQVLSSLRKI